MAACFGFPIAIAFKAWAFLCETLDRGVADAKVWFDELVSSTATHSR